MTNYSYAMIPLKSVLEPKDGRKVWMNYFWAISPNDEIYILKNRFPEVQ